MDNATGTWCLARSISRSPMLGSVNALEPGFRPGVRWGWCHGGVLRSVADRKPPRRPHYPAVTPGPAVSYQSFGAASVLGGSTPPRGPRGAGAHGYPGLPIGRPFGAWPNCRPCAECLPPKFIGGSSQTAMGATFALGATTFIPGPRLPVLGGFPDVVPRFAPSCVGADCGDPLPGVDPPVLGCFAGKRARI